MKVGRRGASIWIEEREAARWILPEGREEQSMGILERAGSCRRGGEGGERWEGWVAARGGEVGGIVEC